MNAAAAAIPSDTVAPRFVDNGDGTVTDTRTGLTWSKATLTERCVNHDAALAVCTGLTIAGHTDWRLPDPHELQSLVDYNRTQPAIDADAFPDTRSDWYWTGTKVAADPAYAWIVGFNGGSVGDGRRGSSYAFVRAVRSPRQ